jgi:hypothetical protein
MGKKSRKGVSRAGVKQHPGAGQSKTRSKSTTGKSVGSSASVMSQDSISIASADMLKSSTLSAMAAAAGSGPNGPPPLDVLNFVNTLMMQQQLQQQQQAEAAEAAASSDPSPGNKENTATAAAATMHGGAPEPLAAADASSRRTTPMIVTLDQSMDEAAMAALIVGKLEEASQRRSVVATLETTSPLPPPIADNNHVVVAVGAVDNGLAPAVESTPPAKETAAATLAADVEVAAPEIKNVVEAHLESTPALSEPVGSKEPLSVVPVIKDVTPEVTSLAVVATGSSESPSPGLSVVVEPVITDQEKNATAAVLLEPAIAEAAEKAMSILEPANIPSLVTEDKASLEVAMDPPAATTTTTETHIHVSVDTTPVPAVAVDKSGSELLAMKPATDAAASATTPGAVACFDWCADPVETKEPLASESTSDKVAPNDGKVDVWSSNLRDVVATSSPSAKEKPVIDVTPYKSKVSLPTDTDVVMTLDTPSPRELDAQKQDCGCVIA